MGDAIAERVVVQVASWSCANNMFAARVDVRGFGPGVWKGEGGGRRARIRCFRRSLAQEVRLNRLDLHGCSFTISSQWPARLGAAALVYYVGNWSRAGAALADTGMHVVLRVRACSQLWRE